METSEIIRVENDYASKGRCAFATDLNMASEKMIQDDVKNIVHLFARTMNTFFNE